jgi:hypothetical protein
MQRPRAFFIDRSIVGLCRRLIEIGVHHWRIIRQRLLESKHGVAAAAEAVDERVPAGGVFGVVSAPSCEPKPRTTKAVADHTTIR